MANSADRDEMACYKPSHQDLHCLQWYIAVVYISVYRVEMVKVSGYLGQLHY